MTAICYPQWDVFPESKEKVQGDAVRASMASTGAEVGGSLILITSLLMVVFLWNALWRPFGAVMRKGHKRTQEEPTFSWDLMDPRSDGSDPSGEDSWKFRVKQPAWRLRKENMKLGRRKSV